MDPIKVIEETAVIVIVRGVAREKLTPLAQALYDGGICAVECTFNACGDPADEEIAAGIHDLAVRFGDRMLIGAGTVLTEKQVVLTKEAGGTFIISPDTNPAVIRATKDAGLVSVPGALTPTEIALAARTGADFIKIFPVGTMGSAYVRNVRAPLSHCRLLAVGGVNEANMKEFFDAGAVGIGIGSGIIDKKAIAANDFASVTAQAKRYIACAAACRKNAP